MENPRMQRIAAGIATDDKLIKDTARKYNKQRAELEPEKYVPFHVQAAVAGAKSQEVEASGINIPTNLDTNDFNASPII